jgi:cobalt-zinc-cadmium efflux system outer membrane protein
VQYESEIQTAIVNLRTAKIQLLQLLNDRTPVEQFDVTGPFDFSDDAQPLKTSARWRSTRGPTCARRLKPFSSRRPTTSWPGQRFHRPDFSAWYTWNSSNNNPDGCRRWA